MDIDKIKCSVHLHSSPWTRRLYDVSNVFLAISERYPLIAKVRATRVGTQNTTAFQYRGPELETVSIDLDTIFNLPDYRRKHLCFDYGKQLLGIIVSSVVEFKRWWVIKSKIFSQKSIYSKETNEFWEYGERQFVKIWAWF